MAQGTGSPALDATGRVATITPAAALAASTSYSIQVVGSAGGVKDLAGNAMAATYQQVTGFTTAAPLDTTGPSVASASPADGATSVAVTVRPSVSFSEALLGTSVTAGTVRLIGPGGTAVAQGTGSPALDATGKVATITPAAALAASTRYQIQVLGSAGGVKDLAGNAMAATYQQVTGDRKSVV